MRETRKLAAILAADVVGYSRLAGADEERTLARLRALRSDLIDPTIAVHRGGVVKRTGDGALIEFRSVVDAMRCAIEIQNGMVERCQLTTAVNVKTILLADPVISRDISLLQLKQRLLSPAALRMKETLVESVGRLQANYADAVLA